MKLWVETRNVWFFKCFGYLEAVPTPHHPVVVDDLNSTHSPGHNREEHLLHADPQAVLVALSNVHSDPAMAGAWRIETSQLGIELHSLEQFSPRPHYPCE